MKQLEPARRILAMVLSLVMVLGLAPVTALAEPPESPAGGEITAFAALPMATAHQEVPLGTVLAALDLPSTLTATVRVASPTDAEPQEEAVPVIWVSNPDYAPNTAGDYIFTARLGEGYTLADAVEPLKITVTVQAADSIDITGLDVSAIKEAIETALAVEGVTSVTVTGSKTSVTSALNLGIPEGKTVMWQAVYQGSTTWRIIDFSNIGTFEVTGSGVVENTGTGNAIFADNENSTVTVSGNGTVKNTAGGAAIHTKGSVEVTDNATVSATTGSAIYAEGASSTVTVSGGTVSTTTGNAIHANGKTATVTVSGGVVENAGSNHPRSAIYMSASPDDTAAVNVTVSGNGTVRNTAATNGHAIFTSGSVVVKDTATVSVINGVAIRTAGVSSTVTVSGGMVSGGTGSAIFADGANAVVTVSGGTVSGAGKTPGYPVITMIGTPASAAAVNVTVSGSGTVKNTATDGGYAINTNGSVAVMDAATVSSVAGIAIAATTGNITVSGGTVSDATGVAFHSETGDIMVSGGVVFAETIHLKYGGGDKTPSVTGQGVTIEWNAKKGVRTYPLRGTGDLTVVPTGAQAYWYNNSAGEGGVTYKNGTNEGFIPVAGVTVEKITLTKDNFTFAISINTYNGNPQGIGTITPKAPHNVGFNATTGGTFTVFYEGMGGTDYAKSATAPTNAGSYAVTVEIGGGTEYAAASIPLGSYTIAKAAAPSITWPTAGAITYGAALSTSVFSGGSTAYGTFAWDTGSLVPNAGSAAYPVTFTPSDTDNYDWSGVTLTNDVSLTVNKGTLTVPDVQVTEFLVEPTHPARTSTMISADIASLVAAIKLESDVLTYTLGTVTGANAEYWLDMEASQSGLYGTYSGQDGTPGETAIFPITVSGFTNYNDVVVNVVVTLINKTTVTIGGLSIASSTYNGSSHPGYTGTASFTGGTPTETTLTVQYTGAANGGAPYFGDTPPTNAGSYTVTVSLAYDALYKGEWSASFTIAKATPSYTLPAGLTATYGQTLADVSLSGHIGFSWNDTSASVGGVGSKSFSATYTPADTNNYNIVNDLQIAVMVNKADPAVTWPASAAVTYGQTLAQAVLSGQNGAGTFAFINGAVAPTVAQSGTAYQMTFTPTDGANYNTLTQNVSVTVNKAEAPVIPTQTVSLYRGMASTGNTVNLVALLPANHGGATYDITSSNTLVIGAAVNDSGLLTFNTSVADSVTGEDITIEVTMANYNTATITVTVNFADKKVPVVTAAVSGSIGYGQPLSTLTISASALVDGTVNVLGSIAWDAPSFKPAVGAPAQGWTFTPQDTAHYETVTGSTAITVNKATPSGTPAFTAITQSGKTLADANLSGSFTNPYSALAVAGTLAWDGGNDMAVLANTAYGWTFTPDDTANYTIRTGSFTPYTVNGGGGYTPPAENPGTVYNNPSQPNATVWLSGSGFSAGDTLVTEALTRGSDYNALIQLAEKGDILRVYDISLKSGKRQDGGAMHLTFALGAGYAGQSFTLVHKKADGTFEYFFATADAKGQVKFGPLYELSPFMLVKGTLLYLPTDQILNVPKTGGKFGALPFMFLALAALCGTGAVVYRKKRT